MRLFLLLVFSAFMLLKAYKFTDETDKQALFEFKSQVSGEKRVVLSSWNNSFPLCSWTGVTCGRKHKRVTGLDLGGLQLGGVISPSIGNLSFLISLNLTDNSFGGTIPQEMGNLFRIQRLFMAFNFLQGGIPTHLFNCSRLLVLQLFSNHLGQGIPSEIGTVRKLLALDLGRNNLRGKLPASLGNLTSLREVSFAENHIEGGVPDHMARLTHIVFLQLTSNNFSGVFPLVIYNMSSLEHLSITSNGFSGSLRSDFGNLLPNLRRLYVGINYLTGAIPATIDNISTLETLAMESNGLTGGIPPSLGKLWNLRVLSLLSNHLGSQSYGDLDFLGALTNCTQLQSVRVANNTLGGYLPTSIANLSKNLIELTLEMNFISGSIPSDIGNLISLQFFEVGDNLLTGTLPYSLGKLSGLGLLSVYSNRLSGKIPSFIGNISRLVKLYFDNNSFEGIIPPSLGNCSSLLHLNMAHNKLTGAIPHEIMQITLLVSLRMSNNSLTGSLPQDVGRLTSLVLLSVAHNKLSGHIPETMAKCLSMEKLYLQGNSFDGPIPDISGLLGVREVDLSNNNLSGSIPEYLANIKSLENLNLSVNNFQGKVPRIGKFKNATIVSVFGNINLCGGVLEMKLNPCLQQVRGRKHSSLSKEVVIGIRKKNKASESTPSTLGTFHEQISYVDLRNATDGFSSRNLIGSGIFGTVFKALLPAENKVVAVKVLNLQQRGAMKSFMAECESLKGVRHRNLVKLLTACSSIDFQGNQFRALIYEFMTNGSLDMWLHPEEIEEILRPSRTLTLLERLNIAIDVASVLDYLHVHCHEAIAHCDIKPTNVLLDDGLTAHVSDFGLARILLEFD
ncbi:hypothetical protein N665_0791s0020 [Sinapis alba]|nr:hypothetical protein N665_0791s0020 [Sinapis alba]